MKYLSFILMCLLIFSIGYSQTYNTPVYNNTVLIYRGAVVASTATFTIGYIPIGEATDLRLCWTSGDSIDVVVAYVLRNSITGAVTASATIDSAVTTKANGSKGMMTAIALSTMLGYDQIKFTVAQSGDKKTAVTTGQYFKLYMNTIRRNGGQVGDVQGRIPQKLNNAYRCYTNNAYTLNTANDTMETYIPLNGISGLRVYDKSTDSLVADIYYILRNSIIDSTCAGAKLGSTVTHVQPLGQDTCTSPGALAIATLIGWDQIKFYVDYKSNSTSGNAGEAYGYVNKLFVYLLRRAD
jgi:hypothetical protein